MGLIPKANPSIITWAEQYKFLFIFAYGRARRPTPRHCRPAPGDATQTKRCPLTALLKSATQSGMGSAHHGVRGQWTVRRRNLPVPHHGGRRCGHLSGTSERLYPRRPSAGRQDVPREHGSAIWLTAWSRARSTGCVIDLLGRAGRLDEASELIIQRT
jgi:hypothetical protein